MELNERSPAATGVDSTVRTDRLDPTSIRSAKDTLKKGLRVPGCNGPGGRDSRPMLPTPMAWCGQAPQRISPPSVTRLGYECPGSVTSGGDIEARRPKAGRWVWPRVLNRRLPPIRRPGLSKAQRR
ncbi:MAG: hypothetical protein EA346_00905 [Thioalkalivibrio sp.]|nr:MAG: hypothetical protein EA346_00905 [Thioalkalivibrio sp.]